MKKYLIFTILLILLPISTIKAEIRYDVNSVVVDGSSLYIDGWGIITGINHCGNASLTVMDYKTPPYLYTNATKCGGNKNQASYKIIVKTKSGSVIDSYSMTRNGNSLTCQFYIPNPNLSGDSCYYSPANGIPSIPSAISIEALMARNQKIDTNDNSRTSDMKYYDAVGFSGKIPRDIFKDGSEYVLYLQVSVGGSTEEIALKIQNSKISGDTDELKFQNTSDTVQIVENFGIVGRGTLNSPVFNTKCGSGWKTFLPNTYTYTTAQYRQTIFGNQYYYMVGLDGACRTSPGSVTTGIVPAAWIAGGGGGSDGGSSGGGGGGGDPTIIGKCDPATEKCDTEPDTSHKELYCMTNRDDIIPNNGRDSLYNTPANTFATKKLGINNYCSYACEEKVVLSFPDNQVVEKAGMAFSFAPLELKGKKICATADTAWGDGANRKYGTTYNMEQWVKNWNLVNNLVGKAKYQLDAAIENFNNYNRQTSSPSSHGNHHYETRCARYDWASCTGPAGPDGKPTTIDKCYEVCRDWEYLYHYGEGRYSYSGLKSQFTKYSIRKSGIVYSEATSTLSSSSSGGFWACDSGPTSIATAVDVLRNAYYDLVAQRNELWSQLQSCNNAGGNYDVNPNVTITIEDPFGDYHKVLSAGDTMLVHNDGKTPTVTNNSWRGTVPVECSVGECPGNSRSFIPVYSSWKKVWNLEKEYVLPTVWINKVTGEVEDRPPLNHYGGERVFYTSPYSAEGIYKITVNYGTKGQTNGAIAVGLSYEGVTAKYYTRTLNCTYAIDQYTYCDPNDPDCGENGGGGDNTIDPNNVSYYVRTVSLTTLFPDGRTPGYNWRGVNELVNKIQRDGNNIYNKKPMYSITLTPEAMRNVRTNNKNMGYRYGSFTGFNFDTKRSDFLSSVRSLGVEITFPDGGGR